MPELTLKKQRPKHLALTEIRLPIAGFVSILHRVSGALLFLSLPLLLYLFGASLGSAESFAGYQAMLANPLAKLVLLALLWAYLHHFCAGIRFLFLDVHVGIDKHSARRSAVAVLAVSIPLTLLFGGLLLW